jgi:hypothetical protein
MNNKFSSSTRPGALRAFLSLLPLQTVSPAVLADTATNCFPAVDVMRVMDRAGAMGTPIQQYNDARQACSNLVLSLNFACDQTGLVSYDTAATLDPKLT